MVDIQSASRLRLGEEKKEEERKKKSQLQNILSPCATQGGHKYAYVEGHTVETNTLLLSLSPLHKAALTPRHTDMPVNYKLLQELQECQHPLTGQRAANFMLLANQ